jgi:PPK2 family polyphosphate:nucleotide phosphotransferase
MDSQLGAIQKLIEPFMVKEGRPVDLERDYDPGGTPASVTRKQSQARLAEGLELLARYQELLAAQNTASVLLVLQGLDASGKDSMIKHVTRGLNPQGVEVHSFKQPSVEELNHDFLWRYQRALPAGGRIGIFNRSHYEEVLVVRVHPELLAAEAKGNGDGSGVWKRRYRDINDWERHLTDGGTRVVKVMLNLSKDEQARRFLERIDHPEKNWKFSVADIAERRYWDDYRQAFAKMLTHTSTKAAPWYVVPADQKWFARLVTAGIMVQALAELDPKYPKADPAVRSQMGRDRVKLEEELRSSGRGAG